MLLGVSCQRIGQGKQREKETWKITNTCFERGRMRSIIDIVVETISVEAQCQNTSYLFITWVTPTMSF